MKRKSLVKDEKGVAYAEFLIAFPPVLILFLCLVQLSLMYVGKLAVRHSANRAARAAVVVIPDDPQYYDGEAVNEIDYQGSGTSTPSDTFFGSGLALGSGSPRIRAVRSAAYIPLTPFAPSIDNVLDDESVRTAFDRGVLDALAGAFVYNRGATAVTFPPEPGSDSAPIETFDAHGLVTTRVTYFFHCGVPIVNRFMCDGALELLLSSAGGFADAVIGSVTDAGTRDELSGILDTIDDVFSGDSAVADGMREMGYAEAPWLLTPWALGGGRFVLLRAEAVMPNQGAGFEYE
ncbi:MAG: pilus assembly protein [Sandaracinus sp.]|nr:pilus assembly protein [Sandaracinus sp.]MCB9618458.1 pilus assembly protein [Sandaracinus sp.]MCB9624417.1 pilus assembly protein [Sandaracinus sp.]MCB9636247.1 pilus assembly protein [Sandaracinus sp.]